ncbi:MAG: GNAT family N-acetyltransferase [Methylobacter sp.]
MNETSMELTELNDDALWDRLVESSPQGTVFSQTGFLRSLARPFRRYLIGTPHQPLGLCCAIEDDSGEQLLTYDYTPYQGILFLGDSSALPRQRVLNEFRITEFAVHALTERYRSITMPLSWNFTDLRPFLWHNYHDSELGQFAVTPRYTAMLDLTGIDSETFPAQVRTCRRQEWRKGAGYNVQEETDIDRFMALYELTFARQQIALPEPKLALVRRITCAALEQGYGRLTSCTTPKGVASMTLFLFDKQRAYYLFAANDPDLRNTGAASRLMFDNIFYAQQRGLAEFDFVGVNSPNRGDFKLSFNPELKLYFEVRFTRGERSSL